MHLLLLPCLCSADMPDGGKAVTSETQSSPEPEGPGKTGEEGEISAAATIPATQGVLIVHGDNSCTFKHQYYHGYIIQERIIPILLCALDNKRFHDHIKVPPYVRLKAPTILQIYGLERACVRAVGIPRSHVIIIIHYFQHDNSCIPYKGNSMNACLIVLQSW